MGVIRVEPLVSLKGKVARLPRINVDTDQIIPKQFLKRIEKSGFGQYLFNDWRLLENGQLNPDFPLNQPSELNATILLAGDNFGCGSSREHAVWALRDYGFRIVISTSFADIFYSNCFKNGVLPIVVSALEYRQLLDQSPGEAFYMTVNLEQQTIEIADGMRLSFEIDPHRKEMLIEGLDDIGLTLLYNPSIARYEAEHRMPYQLVYRPGQGQR